jgi:hypothetical protein
MPRLQMRRELAELVLEVLERKAFEVAAVLAQRC